MRVITGDAKKKSLSTEKRVIRDAELHGKGETKRGENQRGMTRSNIKNDWSETKKKGQGRTVLGETVYKLSQLGEEKKINTTAAEPRN